MPLFTNYHFRGSRQIPREMVCIPQSAIPEFFRGPEKSKKGSNSTCSPYTAAALHVFVQLYCRLDKDSDMNHICNCRLRVIVSHNHHVDAMVNLVLAIDLSANGVNNTDHSTGCA